MELLPYEKKNEPQLITFLAACLPESGRSSDWDGRHQYYRDIENHFIGFWCLWDEDSIIGTDLLHSSTTQQSHQVYTV